MNKHTAWSVPTPSPVSLTSDRPTLTSACDKNRKAVRAAWNDAAMEKGLSLQNLAAILDVLDELANAIGTQLKGKQPDFEYILDHYSDSHEEIGDLMRGVALERLAREAPSNRPSALEAPHSYLDHVRGLVKERMKVLFSDRIDSKYLDVPNYGWTQRVILEFLAQNAKEDVRASRLRLLIRDQVHTERRMRELRDLGFDIHNKQFGGKSYYKLESLRPDLDRAARLYLDRNLRQDTSINAKTRCLLLLQAELGRPVDTKRLSYASRDQGHYDKRIRELPYTIFTHLTHRDVPVNHYLLESLEEKPSGEEFSAAIRGQILKRDSYTCQQCGWSPSSASPGKGPKRYVNAHHKKPREQGGGNTLDNGITLCNLCHAALHPKGKAKKR